MIERLILEIDAAHAYCVIGMIKRKLDRDETLTKGDYSNFNQAKELIRRRDYYVSGNERYRRQHMVCLNKEFELRK